MDQVVFAKCRLSRGAFPTEAAFRIPGPFGGEYLGSAPIHHCYTREGARLATEIPADKEIDGLLIGLVVGPSSADGNITRVHLPDGELYQLSRDALESFEERRRVPIQS